MEPRWNRAELIRAGIMGLAPILILVGMFLPWWSVTYDHPNRNSEAQVRPFKVAEDFPAGSTNDLASAASIVGILTILTLATTIGLVALNLLPRRFVKPWHHILVGVVALGLGAGALVYAYLVWPDSAPSDWQVLEFEKRTDYDVSNGSDYSVRTSAGFGFYAMLLGVGLAFTESTVRHARELLDTKRFEPPAQSQPPPEQHSDWRRP